MTSQKGEVKVVFDGRPKRERIIEKDEILSLIIDLEILNTSEFYDRYLSLDDK